MNKKILTIGATSAVAALLPVVGVFATTERTDTLNVTVEEGCAFAANATDSDSHSVTLAPGTAIQDIMGVKFDITCSATNSTNTWRMSAVGSNNSTDLSDGASHTIATGTTLDGSASNWAFKVSVTGDAAVQGTYGNYSAVPGTAQDVVKASTPTEPATEPASIQAMYAVGVSSSQDKGTYTGGVTYTLTNEAKSE